ncbi:MAG: hypothetical protein JW744_01180 [Candidatus Diapherotrites archaeon]|uniref:KaiC domain-containing protein n=1 Tax=Candidatus Iainarchaeum sp. TaxID=3101447 RepID=A0A938YWQ1_9ARCH|nr:hypothetical protein [Candidatus Diapherotrites archaeon]
MAELGIVKTGTPGLDEVFGIKGFKEKSSILVTGEPGAGKSILAMQFIYNGARLYGETGVFVTSEQSVEKVREVGRTLGMNFEPLEKKGLVRLMMVPVARGYEMAPEELMREVKKTEVKRVAIDSVSPFRYLSSDVKDFRIKVMNFIELLTKHDVTLLVTAEKMKTDFDSVEFAPIDFLFDGLILMGRLRKAVSFERVLTAIKMRGTSHSEELHPVRISDKGMVVETLKE